MTTQQLMFTLGLILDLQHADGYIDRDSAGEEEMSSNRAERLRELGMLVGLRVVTLEQLMALVEPWRSAGSATAEIEARIAAIGLQSSL